MSQRTLRRDTGIVASPDHTIAVTLQLTDTSSREILWADRLVASVDEIGDLRARIVTHLVAALEAYIPLNEARLARLNHPDSLDAWANYHVGLGHLYRFTAVDTALAQACFERSVSADP